MANNRIRARAKAIFPTVLLTLLSIVQALALGHANIGLWFAILSSLFAAMSWISHVTMRRARQDDDNVEFFSATSPAVLRDHLLRALPVAGLLLLGIAIWISANQGWFAFTAIVGVIVLLSFQIWMNHVYTQRSYAR